MAWIRNSFLFSGPKESFFIFEPLGFRGINCRVGIKGVITAAHFDEDRNFMVTVRGRKGYFVFCKSNTCDADTIGDNYNLSVFTRDRFWRYVLLPIVECKNLSLLRRNMA